MKYIRSFFKNLFLDTFYFKVLAIALSMLPMLPFTEPFVYRLLFSVLVLGAVQCIIDLIVNRRMLTSRHMIWLIAFCACFFITIMLNITRNFTLNLTTWGYTVTALLVFYPNGRGASKEKTVKQISVINTMITGFTAIASTVSLVMYAFQFQYIYEYYGDQHVVGWYQNRLFGVYGSTGLMFSAIGIALAVIQLMIYWNKKEENPQYKIKTFTKIFIIYSIVVNTLSMLLEFSKAALISMCAFLFVLLFFLVFRWLRRKNAALWKRWAASLAVGLLSVAVFLGGGQVLRKGLAYVPSVVSMLADVGKDEEHKQKEPPGKVDIDREIPDGYDTLTGRPKIWAFGMQEFQKHVLWGNGSDAYRQVVITDNELAHFHNLVVQLLVSVGLIGASLLLMFLLLCFVRVFKRLFMIKGKQTAYYPVVAGLCAMLCMFLVNSMAEVTILFLARASVFLFWTYLGYTMTLLEEPDEQPAITDRPLFRLNEWITRTLHKSGGETQK